MSYPAAELVPDPVTPVDVLEPQLPLPGRGAFGAGSIFAVGDYAAKYPRRWRTIREKFAHPELTQEEIARKLHISSRTVRNHLSTLKFREE